MMLPTFDVPPVGPRQGKVWGVTQLVFASSSVEIHAINVNKDGFCSRHLHRCKWNRFLVIDGKLKVTVEVGTMNDTRLDETVLTAGQITDVPPSDVHWFEALENTKAVEIYWTSLDARDIERFTSGGVDGNS